MGQERSSYLAHSSDAALDLFYGYVMARGWVGWGGAILFNYLAIIAREYFASRIKKRRAHCRCTQAVLMECGKRPQVPSQVLGAPRNLAMEMAQWKSQGLQESHRTRPKQTLWRLKQLWQKRKLTITPNPKKACKYRIFHSNIPWFCPASIPNFI